MEETYHRQLKSQFPAGNTETQEAKSQGELLSVCSTFEIINAK